MEPARQFVDLELTMLDPSRRAPRPLPAGIRLRTIDPEADLVALAQVYNAAFDLRGSEAVAPAELAHLALHPGLHRSGVLLALDGERPVGLAVGRTAVPVHGQEAHEGAIELVAVRPGYRRRGLAQAMIEAVLAWLAAQGVTHVSATTDDPAVVRLLGELGFRPTG